MNRLFRKISLFLVITILFSLVIPAAAFAASEKRVDIEGTSAYVIISNVVEEKTVESYPLFVANAPVTVKFDGGSLGRQLVEYSTDGKLKDGDFTGSFEEIKFDVEKYIIFVDGVEKAVDNLPKDYDNEYKYQAGNYATLSKPGYYLVNGAPLAEAGETFIIQVTGDIPVVTKPEILSALPTASKVLVNGKAVSFEAYNINGNNYFKLRDLAMAVNGTAKNFEVSWDSANNAIKLISGKAYTPAGGELAVSANPTSKEARSTTSKIYLDSQEVKLTAYNIGGNNYFKLRDIAKAIGFGVTWDGSTNTIGIDTSIAYTE